MTGTRTGEDAGRAPIRGVVLDLDGTVYLSGRPLPGAVDTVADLRARGIGVVFVSNNPLVPSSTYAQRLTGMGIPADDEDVLTSGGLTAAWLREHHPGSRILLVSEPSLRGELERVGCELTEDPAAADVVVVSFDRTFDYAKWKAAFDALRAGARFVATNPDATCPTADGELPDCAGIIAALEATAGVPLDLVIGKPSPVAALAALNRLSAQVGARLRPDEVVAVGDRLQTDVRLGRDAGFRTALLLSGVTGPAQLAASEIVPDDVLDGIAGLSQLLDRPSVEQGARPS